MSKSTGVIVVILFLVALTFPFFFNIVRGSAFNGAAAGPQLKIDKQIAGDKCVGATEWMRHNHMKFLVQVREDVVREGIRRAKHGIQGCRSCHPHRDEFCDKCHEYIGVKPECWNCHYYPE